MDRYSIKCSKRPLLVAGHGIRLAKAQEELEKVLDLGIPVVTTFNGFDLVTSDHPNFVGRIGSLGTYGGNNALNQCDVLIMVGTRNNMRQISFDWMSFAVQAEKVVVDIDFEELTKPSVVCDLPICMDAKEFLSNFSDFIDIDIEKGWLEGLKEYDRTHPVELSEPYRLINEFTKLIPEETVVVCGNATACISMYQAGIVKKGQRIFWNSGTASMGYDLPASIGAHYATGKEVYCVTGDGSIMMNIQELQTIRHNNLPIKILLLNNNSYKSIEMTQDRYFEGKYIGCNNESGISFPDFYDVAMAFDFVYTQDLKQFIEYQGMCIFDFVIKENYEFSPKFTKPLEVK